MNGGVLSEAYGRFHRTGPEWGENQLVNHGPMAVEVMVRRGCAAEVGKWVDGYARRLDDLPGSADAVTDQNWRTALGDGRRVFDWTIYFTRRLEEHPWREVLAEWWPRLLPGIAAGMTHGVIRVGHVVRVLLTGVQDQSTLAELAHGLAFWAARAEPVPVLAGPGVVLPVAVGAEDARAAITDLVTAATVRYLTHGHGHPVLLVHTATAPNAVLHTLPALPKDLWAPTLTAIQAITTVISTAHSPREARVPTDELRAPTGDPAVVAEVFDRAINHGDEHVIKFADTAAEVYTRTGDARALAAAVHAATLIKRSAASR